MVLELLKESPLLKRGESLAAAKPLPEPLLEALLVSAALRLALREATLSEGKTEGDIVGGALGGAVAEPLQLPRPTLPLALRLASAGLRERAGEAVNIELGDGVLLWVLAPLLLTAPLAVTLFEGAAVVAPLALPLTEALPTPPTVGLPPPPSPPLLAEALSTPLPLPAPQDALAPSDGAPLLLILTDPLREAPMPLPLRVGGADKAPLPDLYALPLSETLARAVLLSEPLGVSDGEGVSERDGSGDAELRATERVGRRPLALGEPVSQGLEEEEAGIVAEGLPLGLPEVVSEIDVKDDAVAGTVCEP